MGKYYGAIGFSIPTESETKPGVFDYNNITEVSYPGEEIRRSSRFLSQDKVVEDITISSQISIVLDPYAYENYQHIRYAVLHGTPWKVTNVSVEYPRLVLSLGEIYNGPRP